MRPTVTVVCLGSLLIGSSALAQSAPAHDRPPPMREKAEHHPDRAADQPSDEQIAKRMAAMRKQMQRRIEAMDEEDRPSPEQIRERMQAMRKQMAQRFANSDQARERRGPPSDADNARRRQMAQRMRGSDRNPAIQPDRATDRPSKEQIAQRAKRLASLRKDIQRRVEAMDENDRPRPEQIRQRMQAMRKQMAQRFAGGDRDGDRRGSPSNNAHSQRKPQRPNAQADCPNCKGQKQSAKGSKRQGGHPKAAQMRQHMKQRGQMQRGQMQRGHGQRGMQRGHMQRGPQQRSPQAHARQGRNFRQGPAAHAGRGMAARRGGQRGPHGSAARQGSRFGQRGPAASHSRGGPRGPKAMQGHSRRGASSRQHAAPSHSNKMRGHGGHKKDAPRRNRHPE
jgi:hypothetical protein